MPRSDAMGREWLRNRAGVLAEPNFRRFFAGYVTSLLGSSMSTVAIAWAVLDSGAGATGLGYVFAAGVVPQVLVLPVAGAAADRFGRRRVMLAADALRCAAQGALAGAVFAGRPALWVFVLLAWSGGTGEAFFTPALDALTVEMAPRGQLGNANALYGLASSATRIAGPALGGVLVALAGSAVVVAADAASYAVSVFALSLLSLPRPPGRPGPGGAPDPAAGHGRGLGRVPVPDLAVGDDRSVRLLQPDHLGALDAARPGRGPRLPGRRGRVGGDHGGTGRGSDHGGAARARPPARRPMVVATIGTFCYALPDLPMALHATAVWVAAAAFCCGAGSATSGIFAGTAMQQQVPPEMLARVSSLTLFPAYGIGVIGYAIDGPLAAAFGPAAVFGVGAAYGLLSSAAVLTLRSVRGVTWTEKDG